MYSKFHTDANRQNKCDCRNSAEFDTSQTHEAIHFYCYHKQNKNNNSRRPDVEQHNRHCYEAHPE